MLKYMPLLRALTTLDRLLAIVMARRAGWIIGLIGLVSLRADIYIGPEAPVPTLWIKGIEYNLYDLISSDIQLSGIRPVAINNKGQILINTLQGGVLLTPISDEL